ncbi:hypothetical protein ACIQUL_09015 [Streptomyces sp. NPDC090303]|uniref:hypothetical protein n=1 Tax=Streptomyces sp. NPDC090303 TaxID=3365960 RepID=UPI003803ADF7
MGSQDQHKRPDLFGAVAADIEAKRTVAAEAAAPERQARDEQAAADAALYGTAGWDALGDRRRRLAAAHTVRQTEAGGPDAA